MDGGLWSVGSLVRWFVIRTFVWPRVTLVKTPRDGEGVIVSGLRPERGTFSLVSSHPIHIHIHIIFFALFLWVPRLRCPA